MEISVNHIRRSRLGAPGMPLEMPRVDQPDALTVAAVLAGGANVHLRGFRQASAMTPEWMHGTAAFVSASADPMDIVPPLVASRRRNRVVLGVLGMALLVAAFAMGSALVAARMPVAVADPAAASWRIVTIQPSAVVIESEGRRASIAVGGKLPNGDQVLSVAPDRRMVVLASGTVVLHAPSTAVTVRPVPSPSSVSAQGGHENN